MRGIKQKLLLVCALVLLIGAQVALGDWYPGDGHKMHYPQLPDPTGWDVSFWLNFMGMLPLQGELADDWRCSETGPVEDIHFWISWQYGQQGTLGQAMVSIYSNDPCGPLGFSEPNELLWQQTFTDLDAVYYGDGDQGWYDPLWMYNLHDHSEYYQVNITDIQEPFIQQKDKIYWLAIRLTPPGVGWKTSLDHFMDNAVFTYITPDPCVIPPADGWGELNDPCMGGPLDFAFVITGPEPPPKKPVPDLKWSQPPIEYDPTEPEPRFCGWDEVSFTDDPNQWWRIAADDFRCFGSMPIDSIHWWGSHWDWDGDDPPDAAGIDPPILAWRIGFWSNMPADPTGGDPCWSRPEMLLWQVQIPANRVQVERVGVDQHPYNEYFPETCFQYYVDLEEEEVFWQEEFLADTQDDVFWLSIAAIYDPCDMVYIDYPWGWKTRPWSWMDDGVVFEVYDENPEEGMVIDPCSNPMYPLEWDESYDLAFELDTDPNWIKWDQPFTGIRQWPHYEDVESWMEWWPEGITHLTVAADDWQCQGPLPVTALAWWGSYLNYEYQPCNPDFATRPEKPAYFDVSIWTDVPADPCDQIMPWSHPDQIVWQYDAYNYDEVLVGYDKHPHDPCFPIPGPHEPVFRYTARIPQEEWFWQDPNEDTVYWLSIVAVYEQHYPEYVWGWTNHQHAYNDDAVQTPEMIDPDPAIPWQWNEIYDQTGASADLSFTIYTDPTIKLDFGDADDPTYPTLLANDGARHVIGGPWFGSAIPPDDAPDPEPDGQPDPLALGDDNDGNDDEDGVTIPTLTQGIPNNITVRVSGGGIVEIWIDFDGSGSWEAAELVFGGPLLDGINLVPVTAPVGSVVGQTFARCRISINGTGSPVGLALDGEVEDHEVIIEPGLDFGDAPDPCYPTLLPTGARHTIIPGVFLGASIDAELNGQPNATATGDDNNGIDDEDGVVFTSRLMPGRAATVDVTASVAGFLNAWIDFNADGDWADPGEQVFTNQPLTGGGLVDSLTFQVPLLVEDGQTFARFRFNTAGGLPYDGPSDDGEVEDYMVRVDRYFKWSQPPMFNEQSPYPECFWGWDEPSDYFGFLGPIIADDWACEDYRPVSDVHWWGSYVGWEEPFPPPQLLMGFHIGIWTNVKAGVDLPYSHPDKLIWEYYASYPGEVHEEVVGCDYYDAGPDKPAQFPDTCFRYDLELAEDDVFCQDPNYGVYWLSISAMYIEPQFEFPWGWKTREWYFEDDAIRITNPLAPVLGSRFVSGDPIEDPPGTSWDMAFELTTNPDYCCDCGDFDHNGTIELNDVRILAKNWLWTGTPGGYNIGDLNCDGKIDNEDFVIFALLWLDSCP